ncbi:hypothetical protein MM1218R_03671 [Mycobacterium marinum]|uniref:sigma-70 region 4 domain-containing protein n=1 Tax=Mycobacterium marinum TaxID=1781 RepID=UPI000E28AA21|nr:sigma-70 region 4 domain-containing protein [Mycobacterium marinum]AXN45605.1 hypothetical protein MM1218R_03671 [Mycobacterium marinum]RFZ01777.1 hypothetical protein DE4381_05224 [Mycobacterium marinum]
MTIDTAGPTVEGEIVLGTDEAKELTRQIRQTTANLWELVVKAYDGRAWVALEYSSWDSYCSTEFKNAKLRLPREDREAVVMSLRDNGLSTRAIASVTGISPSTAARALRGAGVSNDAPVKGSDGKVYDLSERRQAKQPESRRPNLKVDTGPLNRATKSLKSLRKDDRLERNKEKILIDLRWPVNDLLRALRDIDPSLVGDPRPGMTNYSKGIQNISSALGEETLTDQELAEALGAAQFLYELLRGEKLIRDTSRS